MPRKLDQPLDGTMSFGDHLEELRRRILLGLVIPGPLAIVLFMVSNTLIDWLKLPVLRMLIANGLPPQLQVLTPTEAIMVQVKVSMIAAIVLSAPWILYQAWKFVEPGLYAHERRFVHFLLPLSAVLTILGLALMYFVMLPLMLRVLILIGVGMQGAPVQPPLDPRIAELMKSHPVLHVVTEQPATSTPAPTMGEVWLTWPAMDLYAAVADPNGAVQVLPVPRAATTSVQQMYRLSEYINLVLMLMLAIAIAFQMPLVIVLLGWMGLASPRWLREKRKYALMVCAVLAVIITPPDVISMLIMLVPLYGLYELGIVLLRIAPASAVAEGRVFSLRRIQRRKPDQKASGSSGGAGGADKRREPMDQPRQPAHMETTVPRSRRRDEPLDEGADGGEDNP
jgi:Sec-independent protein secretion pathway component TatC